MHELSIASSIVDTVLKEVSEKKLNTVLSIQLRIGELTAVVPDALQFGFEAITKDSLLEKTELQIETIPLKAQCLECDKEFLIEQFYFICPHCKSGKLKTLQGDELDIVSITTES